MEVVVLWIFFFVIAVIALIFVMLLFIIALRIHLVINSNDVNMTLLWLNPFIKILIKIEDTQPVFFLFIFNKMIFKKAIKKGKISHKEIDIIKATNPEDIHVDVHYGFRDPYNTGIACGAINIATQFINIDCFKQTPDFMAVDDYIYLNATARLSIGSTLIKLLSQTSK